jgi:hypothetical protein
MSQNFQPGDFLVFQLEAGYGLLRLLDVERIDDKTTWHVAAYNEFFPDVESAESAISRSTDLTVSNPHIALTTRAFESTQVARLSNILLNEPELDALRHWRNDPDRIIADRSIRLMLGLR